MKKTFCIFSATYFPNMGGVERYTYNLAKQLIVKGHRVIVVTSNVFCLDNIEVLEQIKIYRMPCFKLLNGRFPVLKLSLKFWSLHRQLLNEKVDYVIVNTRFYVHSLYGTIFANKAGKKNIVIEHGSGHFTVDNYVLDSLGHLYEHVITALIKRYQVDFYGVSSACNVWLRHFKIKAKDILYNSVDVGEISELIKNPTKNYRQMYKLKEDALIVTYTGRLIQEKGILKLLDAVKILINEGFPIYLIIAGEGLLQKEIGKQQTQNIIFLGRIEFSDIVALLDQSDVFCLPTDYSEGFPTSIIEAAACRCFCISTAHGGSKELILDDSYGAILEKNTAESIATVLRKVAIDYEYRSAATEKGYGRVAELFNWNATVKKLIDVTAG